MKVEIVKAFLYAADGIHAVTVEAGAVVEGDCALQAMSGGWGREVKAIPAAPENKAAHPQRNKAKG